MTPTLLWLVSGILFIAAFTQSATGFGSALVAMSLLPGLVGLQTATPLVALTSGIGTLILSIYCRDRFDLQIVGRLAIASIIAIPIGTIALSLVPESTALRGLGLLIVGYVFYDFFQFTLPPLTSPHWAYGFGAIAGLLSGAYNTGGPPVVIYGNCRRWQAQQFKSNLTSFFVLNSLMNIVSHSLQGRMTPTVLQLAIYSIPAFLLGLLAGTLWSSHLNPRTFRRVVLGVLLATGLKLLL